MWFFCFLFYWCIWRHLTEVLFLLLCNFQHCSQWFTADTTFHCWRLFDRESKPSSAAFVWNWWAKLQVPVLGGLSTDLWCWEWSCYDAWSDLRNRSDHEVISSFKLPHSSFCVLGRVSLQGSFVLTTSIVLEKKSLLNYGRTREITVIKGCLLHLCLWVDWSSSGIRWAPCVFYAQKWLEMSHAFSGKSSELEPKILSCGKCCY